MRAIKLYGIVAAAFMAGAFVASPELRAYASTIANDVICNGCVGTSDLAGNAVTAAKIKDSEVKAAEIASGAVGSSEIATDAVGASEIAGVTKLLFAQCKANSSEGTQNVMPEFTLAVECSISGVDGDDSAVATQNTGSTCFKIMRAFTQSGQVQVFLKNDCTVTAQLGTGAEFGIIVFDK